LIGVIENSRGMNAKKALKIYSDFLAYSACNP
jgi:hypothetical protein